MITSEKNILAFLSNYNETVIANALALRTVILKTLPGVKEQIDLPAKMIMYLYGQSYAELVCNIIPSKKGLKLGFNRGIELTDPNGMLEGSGKLSRYVVIESKQQIETKDLKELLDNAFLLYKRRMKIE